MSAFTTKTGKANVIVAPENVNSMDNMTHTVLDDLLYNVVQDLLLKVHHDEKMAKANSAAISVEKLALQSCESSNPDLRPDIRVENDAAIYEDGKVTLKGNPLEKVKEILCPRCHLPRLLHPTDGKAARKPDPSVIYCKKHPYIDKPGYDIYGQTWLPPGPGRGKKKKDMKTENGESPGVEGGTAKDRPPNVLSYPSATCSKCKRCILVTRLNNHMGSCIGNSGRNASRAAAQKISSNGGSQKDDKSPPGSTKGTPHPGSRANSPRKRDGGEFDEDNHSPPSAAANGVEDADSVGNPKKKKLKKNMPLATPVLQKKVIIKTSKPPKEKKAKGGSQLSQEQRAEDIPNTPVNGANGDAGPHEAVKKKLGPGKKGDTGAPSAVKKAKLGVGKFGRPKGSSAPPAPRNASNGLSRVALDSPSGSSETMSPPR